MCMHATFQLWTSWSVFKKFDKNVELLECVPISYFNLFLQSVIGECGLVLQEHWYHCLVVVFEMIHGTRTSKK